MTTTIGIPAKAGPHLRTAFSVLLPEGVPLAPDGSPSAVPDRATVDSFRHEVAASIFGVRFAGNEELEDWLRPIPGSGYARAHALNLAILPLVGVGENCLWLNGGVGSNRLHEFRTLADLDREAWKHAGDEGPYIGYMLHTLARWLQDGRIAYGTLSLANETLMSEAVDEAADAIRKRWPTTATMEPLPDGGALVRFEPKENHEAFGFDLTKAYDEARRRKAAVWDPFFSSLPPAATVTESTDEGELHVRIEFSNPSALEGVETRRFLSSLATLPPLGDDVEEFIEEEKRSLRGYAEGLGD